MTALAGCSVLVTGGAGFIGSHMVDALVEAGAASVDVVDNLFLGRRENVPAHPSVALHVLDASDGPALRDLIRRRRVDIVFDLATMALGHSFADPLDAFHVNTLVTGHLLESQRQGEFGRFVHFSSSEAYGTAREVPMSERHPMLPETTYAAGKAAADLLVRSYQQTFGSKVLVVRPFNNYGPRQNAGLYAGVVPITVKRLLRGEQPVIHGDGAQTRDFIHVADTARIVLDLAQRDDAYGATLNVGTGVETPIRDLVALICRAAGYGGPVAHAPPRPADVRRHCADVGALRALAGPPLLRTLEKGLAETWEWYRANRAALIP